MNESPVDRVENSVAQNNSAPDWGIESTQSHEFSVGIFIFLIISIAVFTLVVIKFMRSGKGKALKIGEKIMFGWIFFGIIVAVIMGATQLFYGQLF